jgi:hypothetical protein
LDGVAAAGDEEASAFLGGVASDDAVPIFGAAPKAELQPNAKPLQGAAFTGLPKLNGADDEPLAGIELPKLKPPLPFRKLKPFGAIDPVAAGVFGFAPSQPPHLDKLLAFSTSQTEHVHLEPSLKAPNVLLFLRDTLSWGTTTAFSYPPNSNDTAAADIESLAGAELPKLMQPQKSPVLAAGVALTPPAKDAGVAAPKPPKPTERVTKVLQGCHTGVTEVSYGCYKGVTRVSQ